jgi:hypothetical protein
MAGLAWMAAGAWTPALAQEPDDLKRGVARISLLNGEVNVQRGDSGDWVAAAVNAPVMAQDRITTGGTSRAEVQFDWANMLRIGSNAEISVAQLEYKRYMLQLARGTVTFRVLRDSDADVELDTPSVSVRPSRRGVYRISVRDDGTTEVTVRAGDVEVFTPRGSQRLTAGQRMEARGTASDPEFQIAAAYPADEWDRWNESRDLALERSSSYRYVSRDVYGADDLDANGTWVYDAPYGYVWRPTVAVGWAPYRYGRWAWVDWYGWTWVSYDSWGWAPYHYGRWYYGGRGWCWYPGGIGVRHYWSPALVAFFGFGGGGGVHVGIGVGWGNVGWVPLGPHERFSPWWGRSYYGGYRNSAYIDRSVHITNVNITNVYRNSRVVNGVTAVNAGDFSRGHFGNNVRVDNDSLRQASLSRGVMPAVPGDAHLRYSDRTVHGQPSRYENTRFFSNRQPDQVQRVSFAEQRQSLERVSRVPMSERTAASVSPRGGASVSPRGGASGSRSVQRSASPGESVRGGQSAAAAESRGWRRMGDSNAGSNAGSGAPSRNERQMQSPSSGGRQATPSRNESGGSWRRFGDAGSSGGSGSSSSPSRNERQMQSPSSGGQQAAPGRSDSGNWRRFGDAGSSGGSGSSSSPSRNERQMQSPSSGGQQAAPGRSDSGNWRRFGDAGPSGGSGSSSSPSRNERQMQSPSSGGRQATPSRNDSGGSWRRFGDPGSASGSRLQAAPSRNDRQASPEQPSRSWNRFGDPGNSSAGSSSRSYGSRGSESRSQPQYSAPSRQRQESIRVSPPVVRERSGGSSGSSMQRQSAPSASRSESHYSGSRSSGSSGGSRGGESRSHGGRGR